MDTKMNEELEAELEESLETLVLNAKDGSEIRVEPSESGTRLTLIIDGRKMCAISHTIELLGEDGNFRIEGKGVYPDIDLNFAQIFRLELDEDVYNDLYVFFGAEANA